LRVGVVNLAVLAGVLRATIERKEKKVIKFLRKKVHPRENPGCVYVCE